MEFTVASVQKNCIISLLRLCTVHCFNVLQAKDGKLIAQIGQKLLSWHVGGMHEGGSLMAHMIRQPAQHYQGTGIPRLPLTGAWIIMAQQLFGVNPERQICKVTHLDSQSTSQTISWHSAVYVDRKIRDYTIIENKSMRINN